MKMMKALLISVLLGAFIVGGCSNSWDDPSSDKATGTVLLTFNRADARTALPEAPQFTKYKLKAQRYVDSEESGSPVEKDITGTTGSMALIEGKWKITVIGYVQENVAAVGESAEFAVTAGASTAVSITLYAVTGQGDGLFTYEINPPSGVELEWAKLTFGEGEAEILTINEDSVYAGSIASAPGVYLVKLEMKTAYQSLIRTELAHIYSNRVTPKVWEIDAADFATYFTLNGTIDTTERAVSAIEAYTADGDQPYGLYQGAATVSDNTWSMALPVFEEETALYFKGTYQNKQITTESSITIPQNTTETYNATSALVFPRPNPLIWEWKAGDSWTSGSIINGVGVLNTGGTVSNTNDGLSMGGARWVLGYTASQTATTNTTNVNYGTLDLSDGFMVTIEYASSNGSGSFYVYLDNNSTSSGNGPLKYTNNTSLIQTTPAAGGGIINFTIKPSDVSLATSSGLDVPTLLQTAFLQFRCESGVTSMLITHILIASKSVAIEREAVSPITPDEGIDYQAQLPDYPSGGVQLNAIVTSATDETESDITWSIDPTSGASVTDGVVSITAAGTYTVTAHVGALSAPYQFKILPAVASVSIAGESTVSVGKTITLTAPVSPDDAVQGVTWSVDNENIATIDADGVLTGVEEGTVTVTATSKGKGAGGIQVTDTYSVTVNQAVAVESVTVSGNTSVAAGGTTSLNAVVVPGGAVQGVTWAVYLTGKGDASGIAAIDQNGLLTAGYPETATIVYVFATSVQDVTKASEGYAVTIGARPAVASVSIEGESTVRVGKTITLTAMVSPAGAVQGVTWSVNNTSYATIDENGVLTGLKVTEGTVTVTVTATSKGNTGIKDTHEVTVTGFTWATATIGTLASVGKTQVEGGITLTAKTGGSNAGWSTVYNSENGYFVYIQVDEGDFEFTLKIDSASLSGTNDNDKTGILAMPTLPTDGATSIDSYFLMAKMGNKTDGRPFFRDGNQNAASTGQVPSSGRPNGVTYIKLTRTGTTLTGTYSADGTAWCGTNTYNMVTTTSMTSKLYLGLLVTGREKNESSTVTFKDVTLKYGDNLIYTADFSSLFK